jgi:hypothetical protein
MSHKFANLEFGMKLAISILLIVSCIGCGSIDRPSNVGMAPHGKTISLPQVPADGVNYAQGITYDGAVLVARAYFIKFIGACGGPDTPQDFGEFWRIQLWGGFAPSDYGRFWLAKDGSKIMLEPPRKGLKSSTKSLLQRQGIAYD